MKKPTVFIGSSSEGKTIAQCVRQQLKGDAVVTIWYEGVFGLGKGTLESLYEDAIDRFDFAVLVLTPDDMVKSRKSMSQAPRDNVLLECGLFIGRLGRDRTFMVFDSDKKIKLPSDLAGVTLASYSGSRDDQNLIAAVGEACDLILDAIRVKGSIEYARLSKIDVGSGRLIYLLRVLEAASRRRGSVGRILHSYEDPSSPVSKEYNVDEWKRAAKYALDYLRVLELIEVGDSFVKITELGREYLKLDKVHNEYAPAFKQSNKMLDIPSLSDFYS